MNHFTLPALLALLMFVSTAHAAERPTLFERMGGEPAVRSISAELIDRVAADPHLGRSFKDAKISRIKDKLYEQICELSGGPCKYTGDTMRETHGGQHITEAEFYGMVDTLRSIMREHQESLGNTNELLRLLAPMKRDIVEGPDRKRSATTPLPRS